MLTFLTILIEVLLVAVVAGTAAFIGAVIGQSAFVAIEFIRAWQRGPTTPDPWQHIADLWHGFSDSSARSGWASGGPGDAARKTAAGALRPQSTTR